MLDHSTINRWRYERLYKCIDPLLKMYPESEWLTVGDFYYGTDAQYIQSKRHYVIASDIDDHFLKKGKDMGYIQNYSKENVESLSFKDKTVDFVLCKESFHHLPRPYLGLYEMLRVSRIGVILIEPYDREINASPFENFANWALRKLKGDTHNLYEISGNYKYSISKREIEKIALGLNLPYIAFKCFNDYYKEGIGLEYKKKDDKIFKKVLRQVLLRDILWKLRLFPPTLLVSIIFKVDIDLKYLSSDAFEIVKVTKNPYLDDNNV
jgi:SAM-dependent methyltransferase